MIGIVYIIWVLDQFYIGSTWDFDDRKSGHNCNMKTSNYKLYIAIRANDNKFVMLVHHEFICENKRELEMEEQNLIDELQPTLNERRAYNSEEYEKERKIEYSKKYYEEISKEHYEENKIEILEKMKQCRIDNPDKYKLINEKKKQDRIDNPDKYKNYEKKNKEKITCICGIEYTRNHKNRHEQSKFHINFCKENNIV